jgi:enoyl-CoA hydratase/carnithine racemase
MRLDVDEARRHGEARGVDDLCRLARQRFADRRDAAAWARELSQGSLASLALSKAILDRTFETPEEQVFALGREAQAVCYTTAEHQESVTAFLDKSGR